MKFIEYQPLTATTATLSKESLRKFLEHVWQVSPYDYTISILDDDKRKYEVNFIFEFDEENEDEPLVGEERFKKLKASIYYTYPE